MAAREISATRTNAAGYRAQWVEAQEYIRDRAAYERKVAAGDKMLSPSARPAPRHSGRRAEGDILVQQHCYRADEMATVLDMAE
jgi:hypothetical protein